MAKSSSLIRWKLLVPFLIAAVAASVYIFVFLDTHMRLLMQKLASDLNGAEVNIAEVRTSLFGGFVEVKKLEFTDPERPDHNRFELGSLRFDLETLALLKAKVVIREASLQDIQIQSRRAKPGFVLPPPPATPEGPSLADQAKKAFEPVKQELLQNALALLKEKGLTHPLGDIDWKEMPSTKALQDLQSSIEKKPAEWKSLTDQLPKPETLQDLKKRASALGSSTDPVAVQKNLAELDQLRTEVENQVKLVQELSGKFQKEAQTLQSDVKNLQSFAKQDLALLQQRLKWPDLDFKGLAEELAGPEIKRYMSLLQFYYAKLRPFLESKEKPAPSRPLRAAGMDYSFPVLQGIPDFWVRKAQISSKATAEGPLGNILGTLSDLSSDPRLVSQAMRVSLEGSFPAQGLEGLTLEATLDHRQELSEDSVSIKLASFPVSESILSTSQDFTLGVHKAKGRMAMSFVLRGEDLDVQLSSQLEQLSYRVESPSERIKGFLDQSLASLSSLSMQAKAKGPWSDLKWTIESNLAEELRAALRNTLSKELAAQQEKLKAEVEGRLLEEQKKLEQMLRDQLAPFERQLQGSEGDVTSLSTGIDGQKAKINQAIEAEKAALQAKADAEKKKLEEQAQAEKKKQEDKIKQELKNKFKLK